MVFLEKFVTNKTLNTKLFDSESNLLPEVREKLLEIASLRTSGYRINTNMQFIF